MFIRSLATMLLALLVTPAFAESEPRVDSNAALRSSADVLLAIDQHRAGVVERIVDTWSAPLAYSDAHVTIGELRERLQALRADHLFAASLAGTLDSVREIIGADHILAATSKPDALQAKALGDSGDDVAYTPVTPCRLVETRGTFAAVYRGNNTPAHTAAPYSPGEIRSYTVQGANATCLTQLPALLNASAIQVQVFGMPTTAGSGDIEILPQGSSFGSTATMVYVASIAFNTVSTAARINPANNQISVQVRGGGAHLAIDVVGYFRRPGNYEGTHTVTGVGATDGGGFGNVVSGNFATVAGGELNTASGGDATVGGGNNNTASQVDATVGGGNDNTAGGNFATVAGGDTNTASGNSAAVAGGAANTASGNGSFVAGGLANVGEGDYSLVAGTQAIARERAMFVWSDFNAPVFDPVAYRSPGQSVNTFNVRSTGGVLFVTGINTTTGAPTSVCYTQNLAGWTCTSDRNVKRNLRPVDTGDVLAKVVAMPVYHWQPKDGPNRDVEHLGPMAQDFQAGFGLGSDDKAIGMQDADGVALAAIQGLHRLVQEKDARIGALESNAANQQRELAELRIAIGALLAKVEAGVTLAAARQD